LPVSADYRITEPSLSPERAGREVQLLRDDAQQKEITMRKTILTLLGASLIAASTMQMAAAAEPHHARKIVRAPASEQFRNSNAYLAPVADQSDWSRYNGGMSAPAGR
jgi:hypothetical protein